MWGLIAGMFEVERGGWKEYFVKTFAFGVVLCVVIIPIALLDKIKYKDASLPIISLVITRQIIYAAVNSVIS